MTSVLTRRPDRDPLRPSRLRTFWSPSSARGRRHLVGAVAMLVVVALAVLVLDVPYLDAVRDDIAAESGANTAARLPAEQISDCFQGFCFGDDTGTVDRWWQFTRTYMVLMWPGVALAILAAGLARAFFARSQEDRSIAPAGLAATIILFSPLLFGIRFALALVMAWALRLVFRPTTDATEDAANDGPLPAWGGVVRVGIGRAIPAWRRAALILVPGLAVAGAIAGIGTQHLTEAGVDAVVGDHLLGVAMVASLGLVIAVPVLVEIPLVGTALLLGMGPVTAGVLLATLAASSPLLRIRLRPITGARRLAAAASLVVAVGVAGGGVALAAATAFDRPSTPTIAYDGEQCRYSGPAELEPGVVEFVVRNDTERESDGHTMAIVVGHLPPNISHDHFSLRVSADPTAPLPGYVTVAGTEEFVFPETEVTTPLTLTKAGRHVVVCLDGGGHYVSLEFSMPQPPGWFDEFRSAFEASVSDDTFFVAG